MAQPTLPGTLRTKAILPSPEAVRADEAPALVEPTDPDDATATHRNSLTVRARVDMRPIMLARSREMLKACGIAPSYVVARFALRNNRPAAASTPVPDDGVSGLSGFLGFRSVGKILTTAKVTAEEMPRMPTM